MDILSLIAAGAIQLTALEIGESPMSVKHTFSYDNKSYDISRFYKPENINLNATVRVSLPNKLIDIGINTGHDTMKLDKDPTLSLGYHTHTWTFIGSIGGKVTHTPCFDDYDRKYFCRTLRAWSDADLKEEDDEKIYIGRRFKF